jgi:O-antigen/teichoic acid export membrane protein
MNRLSFLRGPTPLIGAGLALVVLSGVSFLGLVTRAGVDAPGVAALASLYFLVNTVALGVFSGVEQEMSRAVSQERALGLPVGPVFHVMARQAARLLVPSSVLLLALSPVLVTGPLRGHWELVAELLVGLFAACCASVVRGALAGSQRFGFYSATLATEGLSRLILSVALWLVGVHSVWAFGLAFVLGQFFAASLGAGLLWITGGRDRRHLAPAAVPPKIAGAGTIRFGVSTALVLVVVANLTSQAIVNLPPVVIGAKLGALPIVATAIAAAVTLTRLPMFAFVPLQTMLLPRLTSDAARGDLLGVRKQTARTVAVCVVLGLLGILVLAVIGPQVLAIYLNTPAVLSGATMAGLGVGTLFLMTTNVTQPALLALGRHRAVLISYLTGAAAMIVVFVLPIEPVASAVLATSAGPVAVALVMGVVLLRATRGAAAPAEDTTDEPANRDENVPISGGRD